MCVRQSTLTHSTLLLITHSYLLPILPFITYSSLSLLASFITFSPLYIFECINNINETMVGIAFLFRELYVAPTKLFPMWISVYSYMLVHMWSSSHHRSILIYFYFTIFVLKFCPYCLFIVMLIVLYKIKIFQ